MWFIGVEVEQKTSAPPPKKNPGSAPELPAPYKQAYWPNQTKPITRERLDNWKFNEQ